MGDFSICFSEHLTGHPSYLPTVQEIHLTEKDFRGGDGNWYAGEVEKEITINLKEKEKHETAD